METISHKSSLGQGHRNEEGTNDTLGCTVCVTGANGFIGSWVVSQLLDRGYHVRGTVRNPENEDKNGHLWRLKGADERLKLYKADVLDYDSMAAAVAGCDGVFHTACPVLMEVADPQKDMILPAVTGVQNVLEACANAGVRRVIHTSSFVTCMYTRGQDPSEVPDETCWADAEFYQSIESWYSVAKIQGERAAWEVAEKVGIDMISVLPAVTHGPMLQKEANLSNQVIYAPFVGFEEPLLRYIYFGTVDVRDVADSMILLYETPSASGRYLCCERFAPWSDILQTIAVQYPQLSTPAEDTQPLVGRHSSPSKRLAELCFVFRPLSETLSATLLGLEERGLIRKSELSKQDAANPGFIPKLRIIAKK